ncbi:ASCH domain-containing protein [Kitasatospora sp. NPDC004669]|uniref:ASCH domain-containing protein n=1 Tax=Kitasatospora sp. NPDC004669 TaxID=3154555 RepID=UPI0033A33593
MHLYDRYFRVLASGKKNIEVRVLYPKFSELASGDFIRFDSEAGVCLARVKRATAYESFDQLLDAEEPARIDPEASRQQQLVNLRRIYSPEKEALGVLAIEVELT